jgi:O-antigen ligase
VVSRLSCLLRRCCTLFQPTCLDSKEDGSASSALFFKWNWWYYALLASCWLFIGFSNQFDYAILAFSTFMMFLGIRLQCLVPLYFAIVFFEPVLLLPLDGSSIFRVFQLVFVINLLIVPFKPKEKLAMLKKAFSCKEFTVYIIAMLLYVLFSVLYVTAIEGFFSNLINFFILAYVCLAIYNNRENLEVILSVIIVFSVASGIFGILHSQKLAFEYGNRYVGAYGDPNYSAFLYSIGLVASLGKSRLSQTARILFQFMLVALILSTVSLTGVMALMLIFLAHAWVVRPRFAAILLLMFSTLLLAFLLLPHIANIPLVGVLQARLRGLSSSSLDDITSGRTRLFKEYLEYFKKLPLSHQLFGGLNPVQGVFRNTLVAEIGFISHNLLIDMLFSVGILGVLVLGLSFLLLIYVNLIRFLRYRAKNDWVLVMFKVLTILYSLFLSLYPFRLFYSFLYLI